jgi:hypothetical protein
MLDPLDPQHNHLLAALSSEARERVYPQLRLVPKCPGPESNRHGVSPKGFSYPLQLSLLHAKCAHLESGLYLYHVALQRELGRGRQVSTLSAPRSARLSSGLQSPSRGLVLRL